MTAPKTLLELSGADLRPPRLRDAVLVMIDLQNEYLAGPIALPDAASAIASAAKLLARARDAGAAIIHIAHKGRPGGLFDRDAERGAIVSALAPLPDEPVIEKGLPNAFAGTDLADAARGHRSQGRRPRRVDDAYVHQLHRPRRARSRLPDHRRCRQLRHARPPGRTRRSDRGRHHSRRRARRTVRSFRDHRPRRRRAGLIAPTWGVRPCCSSTSADGLLACRPHRVDGGRHRRALSRRAYLEQEGTRRRQRFPRCLAEGRRTGAGARKRRPADRKRRRAAIHRRPQARTRVGAGAGRSRSLPAAGMAELRRQRNSQGLSVSDVLVPG